MEELWLVIKAFFYAGALLIGALVLCCFFFILCMGIGHMTGEEDEGAAVGQGFFIFLIVGAVITFVIDWLFI